MQIKFNGHIIINLMVKEIVLLFLLALLAHSQTDKRTPYPLPSTLTATTTT
jgi:hypothetical protein